MKGPALEIVNYFCIERSWAKITFLYLIYSFSILFKISSISNKYFTVAAYLEHTYSNSNLTISQYWLEKLNLSFKISLISNSCLFFLVPAFVFIYHLKGWKVRIIYLQTYYHESFLYLFFWLPLPTDTLKEKTSLRNEKYL